MESKLNEQIERNVALNQRLAESTSDVILADVSEGLALSQKEKLASLASNVEFESEEGTAVDSPRQVSSAMEAYMQTLSRVAKK